MMTLPRIVLTKIAHTLQLKSVRTRAALILMVVVAAATTMATAQTYTDIHNFDSTHGRQPRGGLSQGREGNLHGTTVFGGAKACIDDIGCGVVFKITPSGTFIVSHRFDVADGSEPASGLTLGRDGNFYGTTSGGGSNGYGTIFRITNGGSLTTLYNFAGGTDGRFPWARPIQRTDGNFYGTTFYGTAYKITPSGTFTSLGPTPGAGSPGLGGMPPLLQGLDGAFYGTTQTGGTYGWGTVFKITPEGVITVVYSFDGVHGATPAAEVIQGGDGDFYGTAYYQGSYGQGVIFKLTPQGSLTVLHNFPDPNYPNDGLSPIVGLVQATDGSFYGATNSGGIENSGVIFRITQSGTYSILYNFDDTHGGGPASTPIQHTNGKIYGTAEGGDFFGVVYVLDLGLAPFVSLISTSGKVGVPIEILGQGFTGTTAVSFNGTPATFKVRSDTYLTAMVPSGATTGSVTVATPTGTLTSNHEFRVHPVILIVTPASALAGTPVVITGTSFTQTTKVTFGGGNAAATFTVDSDSQVTATVPAGASTGYIVLTTAGGKSRSPDRFTIAP
jgi:uncharacterized repeat protein (TIGR03803 family)